MGTTADEPETPVGFIQKVGHRANIIHDLTAETTYGRRGGRIYPLVLLALILLALVVTGSSQPIPLAVGVLCLVLLGIWLGGSAR